MPSATVQSPSEPSLDHLSWSSVSQYAHACPKRFFYRKVACAPEERVSSSLIFGGAFHCVVQAMHEARVAGRKLFTPAALGNAFDAAWREAAKGKPPIEFRQDETADSLRDQARRMLAAYREHAIEREKSGAKIVGIEHEARSQIVPDAPEMLARLDLLEIEGDALVVTDIKTSRSRWNEAKIRESLPQLVVYSYATLPLVREFGVRKVIPQFVVITKAKSPVVQVLRPDATQANADRLRDLVAEAWRGICSEVFPRREGWQCSLCPYRKRCLGLP